MTWDFMIKNILKILLGVKNIPIMNMTKKLRKADILRKFQSMLPMRNMRKF